MQYCNFRAPKYDNWNAHWNNVGANTLFQQLFRLFSFLFAFFASVLALCEHVHWLLSFAFYSIYCSGFYSHSRRTFERRRREYSMNAEKWMKCSQKMYSIRIARVNKHEHFSFELRFVSFFSLKRTQIYERKSASGKCQRGIQEERSKLWSNRAIKNWMSVKIKCTVSQKQQQQNARNENNWNCQVSLDFVLCTFLCSVNVLRSIASLAFSIFISIWSKFASHSLKEKNC